MENEIEALEGKTFSSIGKMGVRHTMAIIIDKLRHIAYH